MVNKISLQYRCELKLTFKHFISSSLAAKLVEQTGSSGVITSMMYPNYLYFTLSSYTWRITVKQGYLIRLTIDNCILKRDSQIQVYDGYNEASGILSSIETDAIPSGTILSSTNIILIKFEIPTFSESKFKLIWNEVPKSVVKVSSNVSNSLNCSKNSVITVSETDSLKLESPGFPNGYDRNQFCQWTFLPASMGYHVGISFVTIDLEASSNCIADYVQVEIGSDMQNFHSGTKLCSMSQNPRNLRYHGAPNLRVQFQSDFNDNRTGFGSIVMLDCGGLLEGTQGQITNEMTKLNQLFYLTNDTCTWTVRVARGRTIQFDFETLNLATNADKSCNSYILIKNGIHDDSPFLGLGKYCGGSQTIPRTSSNTAIVQFVRNRVYHTTNEFILKFQQIEHDCGGSIQLEYSTNSTIITSPNYPNIPSAHIECIWRVTAPNGELLKIEFLERFDLVTTPICSAEYLEVREGSTSSSPVIGKYCGPKPQPIFSSSNMIRLKYFTDMDTPKNGFKARVALTRCGKSVVANTGHMSSPGFPGEGRIETKFYAV